MAAPTGSKSELKLDMTGVNCIYCGNSQRIMKRCTRCKTSVYCSRNCQIQDWHRHRDVCPGSTSLCHRTKDETAVPTSNPSDDCAAPIAGARTGPGQAGPRTESPAGVKEPDKISAGPQEEAVVVAAAAAQPGPPAANAGAGPQTSSPATTTCTIVVRCGRDKLAVQVDAASESAAILAAVSQLVRIPLHKLKLVHKGKLVGKASVRDCVRSGAVFQAIGEVAESEDGLDVAGVDCVVAKLGVDRNQAVRALRQTQGDVIDAILYLGNK